MAKSPVAGRTKTRLCPPCTAVEAAALAGACLADTLAGVTALPVRRVLALEGRAGRWVPPGTELLHQRAGTLDRRIAAVLAQVGCRAEAVLVGMDTPQITPGLLRQALALLSGPKVDAVLGPAVDGGWWALGLRRAEAADVAGVPMSTAGTGAAQHRRLVRRGRRVALLPELRDVDVIDDARAVAAEAPSSRFALTLAQLGHYLLVEAGGEEASDVASVGGRFHRGRSLPSLDREVKRRAEPFRVRR